MSSSTPSIPLNYCANCRQAPQPADPPFHLCPGCKMRRYCSAACRSKDWETVHKHHCASMSRVSRLLPSSQSVSSQNHFYSFADIIIARADNGNFGLAFLDKIVYVKVFKPWSEQTHTIVGPFLDHNVSSATESVTAKTMFRIFEQENCFLAATSGLWSSFLKHNPMHTFEKLRVPVLGATGKEKGRIMEVSVVIQESLDAVKVLRSNALKAQPTFAVHTITPLRKYKPSALPHPTSIMPAVDVNVHATFASVAEANRCAKNLVLKWEREEFPEGLAVCTVLVEPRYEPKNYGFVGDGNRIVRRIVKAVENEGV